MYTRYKGTPTKNSSSVTCFYCHKVGHIRKDCRLLKYHNPHREFINKTSLTDTNFSEENKQTCKVSTMELQDTGEKEEEWQEWKEETFSEKAMMSLTGSYLGNKMKWIIDSGASSHLTNNLSILKNIQKIKHPLKITTASGQQHSVQYRGEVTLTFKQSEGKKVNIKLEEVIYVQDLTDNLLSVTKLTKTGAVISFDNKYCTLRSNDEAIQIAEFDGQLYTHLENNDNNHLTNLCQHIIHERLGHRNEDDLPEELKTEIKGIKEERRCKHEGICVTCAVTKMVERPFKKSTREKAKSPFEVIHLDLCGPIKPTSLGNNNYALNIIDDYSKFTTVYIIKNKSQASEKIKEYVEQNINHFGRRPKTLRSDGGGEFISQELSQYLRDRGIIHKISIPYTPQTNGTIERNNRSIMETTRALLYQSNLPKYLWGEVMCTASYLINRVRHSGLEKTPFEMWYGKSLDLRHLRTIGTRCYYLNNSPNKKKLDNRAEPAILIGYGDSDKLYRVWNPSTEKIYISRTIKFETEKCPLDTVNEVISIHSNYEPPGSDLYTPEKDQEVQDEVNNLRTSKRSNKGKPPKILTYEGNQQSDTTKDYYIKSDSKEVSI